MSETFTVENGSSLNVEDFLSFCVLVNALIRSASLLCFFVDFCFTFSSVCVPMVRMNGLEGTLTVLTDPDFLVLHIRA